MNYISFPYLGLEFNINPVVKLPFGLEIHWYGIIIGVGILVALILANSEFKKKGFKDDTLSDLALIAIPLSILGARLYYVIFEWDYFKDNLSEIIAIWNGGLAIYGAVITGIITGIVFSKVRKISFWWLGDVGTMCLLIAQSIGRWGNFVNCEAYGEKTNLPWGMMIHRSNWADGVVKGAYHPTFLYESLWNLTGFLISYFVIRKRKKTDGVIFAFYLTWYGIGRFFIEGLRTDSLYLYGNIRVSQLVAFLSVFMGIGVFLFVKKAKKEQ